MVREVFSSHSGLSEKQVRERETDRQTSRPKFPGEEPERQRNRGDLIGGWGRAGGKDPLGRGHQVSPWANDAFSLPLRGWDREARSLFCGPSN